MTSLLDCSVRRLNTAAVSSWSSRNFRTRLNCLSCPVFRIYNNRQSRHGRLHLCKFIDHSVSSNQFLQDSKGTQFKILICISWNQSPAKIEHISNVAKPISEPQRWRTDLDLRRPFGCKQFVTADGADYLWKIFRLRSIKRMSRVSDQLYTEAFINWNRFGFYLTNFKYFFNTKY